MPAVYVRNGSLSGNPAFAFSHRRLEGHTSLIALEGDLDLGAAPELKWALTGLPAAGRSRVVVDLSRVTFMDSTGLSVLVGFKRHLSPGGLLAIVCASPAILKIFEVTGLDRSFELFPTLDAALAFVRRTPGAADRPDETEVSLTGDAAVVLGIASTAMPFARSTEAQAEWWLRALRQFGDAGIALKLLGIGDDVSELESERAAESPPPGAASEEDVVAIVIDQARRIADGRGASAIHTTDVLRAVIEIYGPDCERALSRHGVHSADVIASIALGHR